MGKTKIDNILSAKEFARWDLFYCVYTRFHTGFFAGEGEVLGTNFIGLPHPLLAHYGANVILFYQLENSTCCVWCSR